MFTNSDGNLKITSNTPGTPAAGTYDVTITATGADDSASYTYTLELVNPCNSHLLVIDSSLVIAD